MRLVITVPVRARALPLTFAFIVSLAALAVALVLGCAAPVALALPPGRAYEMVSPPYKGGYGVTEVLAVAPDGESVMFDSNGAFAGEPGVGLVANYYLARRDGVSGWSTSPLNVPTGLAPVAFVPDFSATLEKAVSVVQLGSNFGNSNYHLTEEEVLSHRMGTPDTLPEWEVAGGTVLKGLEQGHIFYYELGASADLCHVVVGGSGFEPLVGEAAGTGGQIYDVAVAPAGGCVGDGLSPVKLVGVNNTGKAIHRVCTLLGASGLEGSRESDFNAISADGSQIFFTALVNPKLGECSVDASAQLFVRVGGSRTLEVSRPLLEACSEVPCPEAEKRPFAVFEGASEDGSRVFFTTTAQLVGQDKDNANDLYMAVIGCPGEVVGCEPSQREVTGLVQVSHDPSLGESAEVQGVVSVAPDGSRVYFVARGVLSEGMNAEGQAPVKGANNLYVYDAVSGHVVFVADLCSSSGLSGVAPDSRCPGNLEPENGGLEKRNDGALFHREPEAQSAGDGGFLVFSTYAQLVKGDIDTAKDVYRYDAASGMLARISVGEEGYDVNGNNNAFDAKIKRAPIGNLLKGGTDIDRHELQTRAVSEDGSRIVFTTGEPLSPGATNGLENAYEWHEGAVSLVSSGSDEGPVNNVVMSPSGNDIFFETVQGLVSQDTDGAADIYDARLAHVPGEAVGVPLAGPTEQQSCSGDACQGPLTNPAPLLVPGSVSQTPGEDLPTPPVAAKAKPKPKVKAKVKKKKKVLKGRHAKVKRSFGRSGR